MMLKRELPCLSRSKVYACSPSMVCWPGEEKCSTLNILNPPIKMTKLCICRKNKPRYYPSIFSLFWFNHPVVNGKLSISRTRTWMYS